MTAAATSFIETFEREQDNLPGAQGWLALARKKALAAFAEAGLPHRRVEEWKYTDLRQFLDKAKFEAAARHQGAVSMPLRASAKAFDALATYKMVFMNGGYRADLSDLGGLPKGVELHQLADVLSEHWAKNLIERNTQENGATRIIDLNTALMRDGVALRIRKGVTLDKPLHLVFLSADEGASHARNLIQLEEGACATILENHHEAGASSYFADRVCDMALDKDAKLELVRLVDEAQAALHLSSLRVWLGTGAAFTSFTMLMGGGISRCQSFVTFNGPGGKAHVNGALALRGSEQGDVFCLTDHVVPGCESDTLYRTVLDGAATGTFQGKVVVRPDAQKTDGRQMTNALLLSRDAAMNAKPELEIYADDVQCAHGSTIGELSKEAIFYLRSRGIPEREARRLLVTAFLDEAIDRINHAEIRDALRSLAAGWFATEAGSAL